MKRSRRVDGPRYFYFFITPNIREDIVFTKLKKVHESFFWGETGKFRSDMTGTSELLDIHDYENVKSYLAVGSAICYRGLSISHYGKEKRNV